MLKKPFSVRQSGKQNIRFAFVYNSSMYINPVISRENFAVTQEWKLIDPVGNIQFAISNLQLKINDIHIIYEWDS